LLVEVVKQFQDFFSFMILTKMTTLEFSVLTSVEASPELSLIPVSFPEPIGESAAWSRKTKFSEEVFRSAVNQEQGSTKTWN